MQNRMRLIGCLAALPLLLTACFGGTANNASDAGGGSGTGQVTYWLWDANQLPAYQACADAFHTANPKITVKITQLGWDDYWSKLTAGLVSGTAPDVFTDHVSKYPEYALKGQLAPLDDYIKKDNTSTDIYQPGLADLWVGQDQKRYGLPKDWDTVALFYNKKMAAAGGLSNQQMSSLTWNPSDGGTYEKAIAHLTVDKNGKRGDEPGFDKQSVKIYGLGYPGSGSWFGQTEWSMYVLSTGWQYTNKNPWGDQYNYSDPKFVDMITWFRSLISKGYAPPYSVVSSGVSMIDAFNAGKYALTMNGDWTIGDYTKAKNIQLGLAPTPTGPDGQRASVFNGLADSITANSKNKDAAWQWVKFLGSAACQDSVASKAVVFPAIPAATDKAEVAFKARRGVDVSAFTVQVKDKTTHLAPITDHSADIDKIMAPTMESILLFKTEPGPALNKATDQINALFK